MDICPPVAILPGQNSTYTPVRKTGTTSDLETALTTDVGVMSEKSKSRGEF
jgi:hypothetical protein